VDSGSIEANIVRLRDYGEHRNRVLSKVGVCPDDVPRVDPARHLPGKQPSKVIASPVESVALLPIGNERAKIADGPVGSIPAVSPRGPPPSGRAWREEDIIRIGSRDHHRIIETANGEDFRLALVSVEGII
jgi:hypothetical protein